MMLPTIPISIGKWLCGQYAWHDLVHPIFSNLQAKIEGTENNVLDA